MLTCFKGLIESWIFDLSSRLVLLEQPLCPLLMSHSFEGEDCDEKSRKLLFKRVKAGLDTGIWVSTQGPHTPGQYSGSRVSREWAVTLGQPRPSLAWEDGASGANYKVFCWFWKLNPALGHYQDRAKHVQTSQRILAGVESLFLLSSNVSITEFWFHFCLFFSASLPAPRDESE